MAYHLGALLFEDRGNEAGAEECLRAAIEADGEDPRAHYMLGCLLAELCVT